MPTANQFQGELVCVMGGAGVGKSGFVMQSPQPHAILCVDKPVIATLPTNFPGYDPRQSFGTFYPPPERDLTDAKALPTRNIFDAIISDIQAIKVALHAGGPTFKLRGEEWPFPKTIIVEGMDFVRDHAINWVLNTQGKHNMDEFLTADGRSNVFLGWGLVAQKMDEVFQNLAFLPSILPVNVIVTVGIDEESKSTKDERGRQITVKTGTFDPAFGGKMSIEAPRKFRDCWLGERAGGKHYMVTQPNASPRHEKFRGLRSGRFGVRAVEDVTIDPAKPVNHWNRLFGGVK